MTPVAGRAASVSPSASAAARSDIEVTVIVIAGNVRPLDLGDGVTLRFADADGNLCDNLGRIVARGPGPSVPHRRAFAARCAETRFIAFLEDTVVPAPGWVDSVLAAFAREDVVAVGGPVVIDPALPSRYRALGLTEYARFHPANATRRTIEHGAVRELPGANFAFRTDGLLAALDRLGDGLIDNKVFADFARHGQRMVWQPSMTGTYCRRHVAGAKLGTRFIHGRIYAGQRYAAASLQQRITASLKGLLLPAVLFGRTLTDAVRSRQASAGALAWAAAMHVCWSIGEIVGALCGPARDGVDRWM